MCTYIYIYICMIINVYIYIYTIYIYIILYGYTHTHTQNPLDPTQIRVSDHGILFDEPSGRISYNVAPPQL